MCRVWGEAGDRVRNEERRREGGGDGGISGSGGLDLRAVH